VAAIVAALVALITQVITGSFFAFHFGSVALAVTGQMDRLSALALSAWFGLPFGVALGAVYVGLAEHWTGGAEWHPIEQRRRVVNESRAAEKRRAIISDQKRWAMARSLPLGVVHDGDLTGWIDDEFVVLPPDRFPAMGLLGGSGSGKTVTAERCVSIWAKAGRKVVFADFKGSDPELPERVVAAYKAQQPDAVVALWPAQPLDMWRGSPVEIANRLMQVQDFSEPFYKGVAETVIRLIMHAPDVDGRGPVRDSAEFLRRMSQDYLTRAWEGRPEVAEDLAAVTTDPRTLYGVRLRYSGFFSALAGRLDHGFSFEDVDLAILTVPTLAQRSDAMATARMVLADFAAYCLSRKPRVGEDVTFIVDEFSAVTEAAPMVIDLAERVRDVGGQVVVSVQSYEGLGSDDAERRRMRDALAPGGLVVHRLADPDEVLSTAGTVRAVEQSWQLGDGGISGMGSAKMTHKMRVDPDAVRQAKTGEAWIVTRGKAVHMTVLRSTISDDQRAGARRLVRAAMRQAVNDLRLQAAAEPQDWWEYRPRKLSGPGVYGELEAGSFGELLAGDPPPHELPPAPAPIDPRIVLAIAAYVRAGLVKTALRIAASAPGIDDPVAYVDDIEQRWKRRRGNEGRIR